MNPEELSGSRSKNFYPEHVYAAGYQQSFGDNPGHDFGPIMPPGVIVMWSKTTIPPGWAICNGDQGTPDLRDRFILAADDSAHLGRKGDGDSHSHAVTIPSQTTSTDGNHTHKFPETWYNTLLDSGGHTGIDRDARDIRQETTQEDGNHHHTVPSFVVNSNTAGPLKPKWYALYFIMKL